MIAFIVLIVLPFLAETAGTTRVLTAGLDLLKDSCIVMDILVGFLVTASFLAFDNNFCLFSKLVIQCTYLK